MGSGLSRKLETVPRVPNSESPHLWKGSRTRQRYRWNTEQRLELGVGDGANSAQAAAMLAGPHESLTPPNALGAWKLCKEFVSAEGKRAARGPAHLRAPHEPNPEKARVGLPPRKMRPFPGMLQDPADLILLRRGGSNNLGCGHPA